MWNINLITVQFNPIRFLSFVHWKWHFHFILSLSVLKRDLPFTTCVSNSFVHHQMCCNASITEHIRDLSWKCTQKPWISYIFFSWLWCCVCAAVQTMQFTFRLIQWASNNTQFSVCSSFVEFLRWFCVVLCAKERLFALRNGISSVLVLCSIYLHLRSLQ